MSCRRRQSTFAAMNILSASPSPATLLQNSTAGTVGAGILSGGVGVRPGIPNSVSLVPDKFPAAFGNASPTEIGLQTNQSIPYHFSAKELPCKSSSGDRLGAGAIVFGMRASDARSYGIKIPEKSMMVSDYIGVNEWLANHANKLENMSTEEILNMWRVCGCMKLKATSANARFKAMGTSVMNNVVGLRVSAANVWGEKAQTGTQLYFVLKKKKKDDKIVWVFCPYGCCDHATPPCDRNGLIGHEGAIGDYVFIGTALSEPMASVENAKITKTSLFVGGIDVCMGV